ncbi:MAG: hypothetical protein DHS20C11_24420 [Lysobacteraceae bacterium]|nr:MAG: hypothetical protein DHS20C11_24420 [Xanthomonadaceae bacterium]
MLYRVYVFISILSGKPMSKFVFLGLLVALTLSAATHAQMNAVTIDAMFGDWLDENTNVDTDDMGDPVCNDHPNQGDIKAAGIASNFNATMPGQATTIYLRFDFDEEGAMGANTFDGCWLLDANANGMVEQALCFSLQGNPAGLTDTRYFTCGDSTVDTCAMNTMVALPASASCAVDQVSAPNILHDCTAVDAGDTVDTAVECEIDLVDLPISDVDGVIALMQACSYNSQQPNSNGVDCVIDGNRPWMIDTNTGDNTTPTVPVELRHFSIE